MKPKILSASIGLILAGVLVLAGCGDKATEQFKDAERGSTNDSPADTITFPDGFSNVSSKCDGPNRVYVVFKGDNPYGSVDVVKDDPRCTGDE